MCFQGAAPAALTFLSVALTLQKVGHPWCRHWNCVEQPAGATAVLGKDGTKWNKMDIEVVSKSRQVSKAKRLEKWARTYCLCYKTDQQRMELFCVAAAHWWTNVETHCQMHWNGRQKRFRWLVFVTEWTENIYSAVLCSWCAWLQKYPFSKSLVWKMGHSNIQGFYASHQVWRNSSVYPLWHQNREARTARDR